MKRNSGITLVALIITIIVLLILAVVTISAVNEGSLFSYVNNAAEGYSKAQEEENTIISTYLTKMEKYNSENDIWKKRGLDTSIPGIIGTTYSFSGPITSVTDNSKECIDINIILNSDGSMNWGRKFIQNEENIGNDYDIISCQDIDDLIELFPISANSITFPDSEFETVTITFESNKATLTVSNTNYISE